MSNEKLGCSVGYHNCLELYFEFDLLAIKTSLLHCNISYRHLNEENQAKINKWNEPF